MKTLLVFICLLHAIGCSCPVGFELVRAGECRGNYVHNFPTTWDTAWQVGISKCSEIQGYPIIVRDDEDDKYWMKIVAEDFAAILGLMCNTSSQKWQWADGSAVNYKNPYPQDASHLNSNCDTTTSWLIVGNGSWAVWTNHGANVMDVYCAIELPPLPDPSADGCAMFDDDSEDGVCYQVGAAAETWNDAQLICKKLGANLASIHNLQENAFVRRLAVSHGAVNGVFLGATLSGKGDKFGWVDGSEWDYENFTPGFPRSGFGDCLAMDTTTTAGQWMNIDCSSKLPVACIRDGKPVVQPTCSTETWTEGAIITSPGFPYSSSTPCDFYLSTDTGKRVELEIVMLEANTCCDHLIIYDGYLGGNILANLSGEVSNKTFTTTSSNIMRVTWQPNEGVNVMGFAMTFRGV